MRTHTHTTHRGHLAQVAGAFHQSRLPPRDARGADGALCAVPGGRRPAGAAQAGTSCGLITEDGDPREQSSGPGQRVRRAPQSPAVPQASKERSGGGAGMGLPTQDPKLAELGWTRWPRAPARTQADLRVWAAVTLRAEWTWSLSSRTQGVWQRKLKGELGLLRGRGRS